MRTTAWLALLAACLLAPAAAQGYWVIVDQGGSGDYMTITEGLAAALSGDQVRVKPGTYSASTGETMPIEMRSNVTLMAHEGLGTVTIDGEGLTRCINCVNLSSTTKIRDLVFSGGAATGADDDGGGMWIGDFDGYKTPGIHRCIFRNNHADWAGGGLYADHTSTGVVFNTCTFSGNTAQHGGGAAVQGPNPAGIVNSVFDSNSASGYGGGYLLDLGPGRDEPSRDVILQRLTFADNSAGTNGAGLAVYHSVRLWNSIVAFSASENDPVHCPGNITATLECCDVYGNAGGDYVGCIAGQQFLDNNFYSNPDFCGVGVEPDDPYSLSVNSPCAEANNAVCGNVGGRLVQCGIPYLEFNRDWIEYYIPFGEEFCQNLVFENAGDLALNWQLAAFEGSMGRGWGGPDAFGYRWGDSDKPDGPDFEWNDISGYGTPLTMDDEDSRSVPLPFEFSFYGTPWNEVAVHSNGYLTFGGNFTTPANDPIPDASQPNNLIAPFWLNLDPSSGGTIHHYSDPAGDELVVQFTDVPIHPGPVGGEYTFQVVLYEDGTIRFYYLSMEGYTDGATIGIENSDGTIGLQVAYNEPYMHDELCVIIDLGPPAPSWFWMSEMSGALSPGEEATVECCVEAGDLEGGIYEATLVIASDDYNYPFRYVPITAEVFPTGVDDEVGARLTLRGNYPNPFNPRTSIAFDLPERARVSLRVFNAAGRLVRSLIDGAEMNAGPHEEPWDGRDDGGTSLASGVYFCMLEVNGESLAGKMVLLK